MSEFAKITPSTAPVGARLEERAQAMLDNYLLCKANPLAGKEELKDLFAKYLRDQVEDCARIVERVGETFDTDGKKLHLQQTGSLGAYISSFRVAGMFHTSGACQQMAADIRALAEPPPNLSTQSAINKGLDTLSTTVDRARELLRAVGCREGGDAGC